MEQTINSTNCDIRSLKNELQNGGATLIDVREFPEYAGGRVKNAKLIPLGEIEKRHSEIDRSNPVYLMCRSGGRSAQAQRKLQAFGFNNTINVNGGFEAWKNAGFEIEKDDKAVWSLERQVRFTADSLVLLGVLLGVFLWQPFILLSAFVSAGLVYSALTDTCGMALVLAKLPWNRQSQAACEPNFSNSI